MSSEQLYKILVRLVFFLAGMIVGSVMTVMQILEAVLK